VMTGETSNLGSGVNADEEFDAHIVAVEAAMPLALAQIQRCT
jgi:hypothetical protein